MKLSNRLLDALMELIRHERRSGRQPYYWRKASMAELVTLGLVEVYQPFTIRKIKAFKSTLAGRELAAGFPPPNPKDTP